MIGSCKKIAVWGALFVVGLPVLSACDLYEEGHLTTSRVQVQQERFVEEVGVDELDDRGIAAFAQHYSRHGDGPIDLTVAYDPLSRSSTAMVASNEASRIITGFRKHGVRNIQPGILPVKNHGDEQTVIISYTSYTAEAPKDCGTMAGYKGDRDVNLNVDYKLGCTIETILSRQVARPKDLKGRDDVSGVTSGRRATNIIEGYQSGVPNEPLGGASSSGN